MEGFQLQFAILLAVGTLIQPGILFPLKKKVTLPSTSTVDRIVDEVRYVAVIRPLVKAIVCEEGTVIGFALS